MHSDIRKVYNKELKLGPDTKAALAVEVRQILDLKLGVAFSRFQSQFIKAKYVGFENQTVSYGPCQIPTLSLVVQRQQRIDSFVPELYHQLYFEIAFSKKGVFAFILFVLCWVFKEF